MAHIPGHSPTAQQLTTFGNLTPQQQSGFAGLSPQQSQGFQSLAGLTPQQRAGLQNLPQQQPIQQGPIAPPTGLIGSEQAIQGGLGAQLGLIAQGVGSAQGEIDLATGRAIQPLQGFTQQGQDAGQQQAALSGVLGPEAQQQAFQAFTQSPGQQFAIEQGEQSVLRNAAATGGVGGGNILRELNRLGIGQAQQNFQQEFQNLGTVAGRGFQGAGLQAGIEERGGSNLANLALQGGVLPAQAVGTAAGQVAQGRFGVGQQLAQAAQGISTGQANLQNQLGGGLAAQFGQGSTNLANLTSGTGAQSAQLQQNLATILANIGTGSASGAAGFTNAAAQFDASGILGQNTAVQNTLQQLLQLIPQGGGGGGDSGLRTSNPFTPPPQQSVNPFTGQ